MRIFANLPTQIFPINFYTWIHSLVVFEYMKELKMNQTAMKEDAPSNLELRSAALFFGTMPYISSLKSESGDEYAEDKY